MISGVDLISRFRNIQKWYIRRATIEKAFVDLYYAVTRNGYPLALQELVRIYENLVRLGNIDRKRMIAVAAKRGIQCDLRFIAEAKFVTGSARKFVEILERDE